MLNKMKIKTVYTISLVLLMTTMIELIGCASPKGSTGREKRTYVQNMRSDALRQLYRLESNARAEIANSPGYGVFDAVQSQFLITTTGNAYGIVHDNLNNKDTYMSAFSAGAGFGAGIKGFRAVVVFKDRSVMREFVDKGWVFGASGTADAKSGGEGETVSAAAAFDDRLKIYTFTDTGLMAGASLRGVKVWKDKKLN
jgi:hypothetical protein